jgi:palmitoyl-protein thioesterase
MFAFAGYFRDALNYKNYLKDPPFIAQLNNEVDRGSKMFEKRRNRFKSLNRAMFVKFELDLIVIPPESAVFGEFDSKYVKEGMDSELGIKKLRETDLYKEDLIGLKWLDEQGKLELVSFNKAHTEYNEKDSRSVFVPFLLK